MANVQAMYESSLSYCIFQLEGKNIYINYDFIWKVKVFQKYI